MQVKKGRTVASAVIRALVPGYCDVGRAVPQFVVAVTLIRELDSGKRKPFQLAERDARGARHVGVRHRRTNQRATICTLGNTPELAPVGRKQGLRRDQLRNARIARALWSQSSAVPQRVTAWQHQQWGIKPDLLVNDLCLQNASIRRRLIHGSSERRAVHDISSGIRAVVDRVLEKVDVPAVRKVAMMSVPRRVAIGEDPSAVTPEVELIHRDQHLVEKRDKMDGVAVRAVATVIVLNRVGKV